MSEEDTSLTHLLDGLDDVAQDDDVSVSEVIEQFGDRAITPFMLILSILLISPVSGIPGVPTVSGAILILLAGQALVGRQSLWLPDFLKRRKISSGKLRKGTKWMRKPCAFLDRHAHERMKFLTKGPFRVLALVTIVGIALSWPLLEILPMVTSTGAAMVGLLTFGLFVRDGLYVVLGYLAVGVALGVLAYFFL